MRKAFRSVAAAFESIRAGIGRLVSKTDPAAARIAAWITILVATLAVYAWISPEQEAKQAEVRAPQLSQPAPPVSVSVPPRAVAEGPSRGSAAARECDSPRDDPEFARWAPHHLGQRPDLPAEFDREYPACVAELRRGGYEAAGYGDAAECRRNLEDHRAAYLAPLITQRARFGDALRDSEAALIQDGLTEPEHHLLNLTECENRDFNYQSGRAYRAFRRANRRIQDDLDLCVAHRCQPRR